MQSCPVESLKVQRFNFPVVKIVSHHPTALSDGVLIVLTWRVKRVTKSIADGTSQEEEKARRQGILLCFCAQEDALAVRLHRRMFRMLHRRMPRTLGILLCCMEGR